MKPEPIEVIRKDLNKICFKEPFQLHAQQLENKWVVGFYDNDVFIEIKESIEEVNRLVDQSIEKFNKYIFNDRNYYFNQGLR